MLRYILDTIDGLTDELRRRKTPTPSQKAAPLPSTLSDTTSFSGPVHAPSPPASSPHMTLPPLKHWAHPFGDNSNPLTQLTNLSSAIGGYYPIGRSGIWHGGVHFDAGTASMLDQSYVRCLADGEVVAYRIATETPVTVYHSPANELIQAKFSSGFVLVRHNLQAPTLEGIQEAPPSLKFYSLYMHLDDWKSYEDNWSLARPEFWKVGSFKVKADVADIGPLGLSVHEHPKPGSKVLATLPRGTRVSISDSTGFVKLLKAEGIELPALGEGSATLGYVRFDGLESTHEGYRVKSDALGAEKGKHLNIHAKAEKNSKVIATLPRGAKVVISGEGEYRKLESVLELEFADLQENDFRSPDGYLRFSALEPILAPQQLDAVVIPEQPIPIKSGALIGHIGPYETDEPIPPQYKLHLETFTAENLPKFLEASRAWAKRLPEKEKTWLKLAKGTSIFPVQGSTPPSEVGSGIASGNTLLLPGRLLNGLPRDYQVHVPAKDGKSAFNWYRLDNLLNGPDGQLVSGWVREVVGETPWVSPWAWDGYDIIHDYTPPQSSLAYHFSVNGELEKDEQERLRPQIDQWDQGATQSRLYEMIDSNRDGKLTAKEIQDALRLPAKAQSLSKLVIQYESEWHYRQKKWDELDNVQGHTPSTPLMNWSAEKERIRELKWWDDVAKEIGLPEDGRVYHLHPIGLYVAFKTPPENAYRIFQSGVIERSILSGQNSSSARYIYVDESGLEYDFGVFNGVNARRWAKGGILGAGSVFLVDIINLGSNPARRFGFKFSGTSRTYVSMPALASLIGAFMEVGFEDIVSTGFSMIDGTPGESLSHINGENGDFRFLRLDRTGGSLDISIRPNDLDELRQTAFNEALYKFGWKQMLAWRYTKDGEQKVLPRTAHYANHHHHLHVGKYQPTLLEKIGEI